MRAPAIACVALLVAGCGGGSKALPAGCAEGPAPILKALTNAPGAVAMQGTPISRCFTRDANGDEVQILGTGLVSAAQQLGDKARAGDQQAALQLGYLVGATQRGVKRNGLGAEIARRAQAEANGLGPGRAGYTRGLRAGLAQG
jgi:hypothetical protein